ncbi:hypothetical protein F511_29149 [Dorcoceras hygrometricum]|uniref:Uncharacterized protein n=1 Tax=Dorcoceras hygrometricum TaxID=472368 RepID=A0A2Z7ADQ7_9LAMI|nr:hypothetical protein F511_29149 [Dorcoceras hygrometricum]
MDIVIWTRARWAGPSPLLSLYNVIIIRLKHNFINKNYTQNPSTSRPSLPLSHAAAAAAVRRRRLRRKIGFRPTLDLNITSLTKTTLKTLALAAPPSLSLTPPPPPPCAAAVFVGKLVSGQLDVENPFVLISSGLLVQPDEGVSAGRGPDWRIYRNLPRRAGFLKHRLEPGTSASEIERTKFRQLPRPPPRAAAPLIVARMSARDLRAALLERDACDTLVAHDARWPRDVARGVVRRRAILRVAAAGDVVTAGFSSGLSRAAREVFGPVCDVGPDFNRF